MSRTQMKKSQRWNTMQLSQFQEVENGVRKQLPNHAQIYTLSSTLEKNSKGTWYGLGYKLHWSRSYVCN
jgi:hypothetical protein